MHPKFRALTDRLGTAGWFLFWGAAFALAYAQAPLYYSNQHQYFLHGLAAAGRGLLAEDWLANTADPTPLFSALVAATYPLDERLFYLYYGLLQGVYFFALFGLFRVVAGPRATPWRQFAFVAAVFLLHSALLRLGSAALLGVDYPWYFQAGLAGQYVLGPVFQPSTFGVLLVVSVLIFARGATFLAATVAALAAVLHSTYLLGAGLLVLAYMSVLFGRGRPRAALLLGGWALLLVSPILAYNLATFGPTSPYLFATAQNILANERIPHHAIPRLWFDEIAAAQVAWVVLGVALSRRTPLLPVLFITAFGAAVLTLVQLATGSNTLALLFPWRPSVFLVPVATAVILSRLVTLGAAPPDAAPPPGFAAAGGAARSESRARLAAAAVAAVLAAAGAVIMVRGLGFQAADEELPMMDHVRGHKSPGDVYLLPVKAPNLKATVRGSVKTDFKPAAEKDRDPQFIPTDLQRFRLYTGAPIFVDFKSVPYKDTDVLEWWERLRLNRQFYERLEACGKGAAGGGAGVAADLRRRGVTHVVTRAEQELTCPGLSQEYADRMYRVYRVGNE